MKALSLTQPWATLVAIGAKRIETRSWSTAYRGDVLIHAAKKFPADARCLCPIAPFADALGMEILHTGQVLAVARLVECFAFDDSTAAKIRARSTRGALPPHEVDFGDYATGRFGFFFDDVRPLPAPIPWRGALGLWDVPYELHRLAFPPAECAV